jgi:predicted AAA+ superfamily ATPase
LISHHLVVNDPPQRWREIPCFHFRTHGGREVDIVLEADDGRLVGIEVKAAATVGVVDLKGLTALREVAGKRFHRGVVLYTGRETLPFGSDLWALPVSALWQLGAHGRGGRVQ